MSNLLIVEDDAFGLDGLRVFFEAKNFSVLTASDMETARRAIQDCTIDAAIFDILLPENDQTPRWALNPLGGIQLVRELKARHTHAGAVLFSAYEDRASDCLALCQAGLRGIAYRLKGAPSAELLAAVHGTMAGQIDITFSRSDQKSARQNFGPALGAEERPYVIYAVQHLDDLSPREREVVERIASSYTVNEVAEHLHISLQTAYRHLHNAYKKLRLTDVPPALNRQTILVKALWLHQLGWRPDQEE